MNEKNIKNVLRIPWELKLFQMSLIHGNIYKHKLIEAQFIIKGKRQGKRKTVFAGWLQQQQSHHNSF